MDIKKNLKGTDGPFDIIASTGRTATTYLAAEINKLDGIAATHEGYLGSDKNTPPLLPLVNLENAASFSSSLAAKQTVADLRSPDIINLALDNSSANHLIDVAYYNAMIGAEIMTQHPHSRMIGIIRDCEEFVRSCTTISGEDPLPVGWPDPQKILTDREKFIQMGRIRPGRDSIDRKNWNNWGAIRRNIWLWQETNQRLCAAKKQFNDRVILLRFSTFQSDPESFWAIVTQFLTLPNTKRSLMGSSKNMINKKPSGYQVGAATTWSSEDQAALFQAQTFIERISCYAL